MRLVIPFVLIAALGSAQTNVSQRLDQIANTELTRQRIPGMAIVAIRDGRVVYSKGFGVASAVMAPAYKAGVVVLCNRDGADSSGVADQLLEALLPVRFSPAVPPSASTGADLSGFAGKYTNGANSIEIGVIEGKLTAKTTGDSMPLQPAGTDCFSGTLTVCFANGYAHVRGRAFRKQ